MKYEEQNALDVFFALLGAARSSRLLLDYDGTLAPFVVDRMAAFPYAGVVERLAAIEGSSRSGVVLISGRPVSEVQMLARPLEGLEIWGAHGIEHLSRTGKMERAALAAEDSAALALARERLEDVGMIAQMEEKPGGVAAHWRGYEPDAVVGMNALVENLWKPLLAGTSLRLLAFDGGVELRVTRPDKGDAVRAIRKTLEPTALAAYLGDDATDEDAFRAMAGWGLSVLVREEKRESGAEVWIRPPEQLLEFLDRWVEAVRA
uniref:Putative Trehalose 6-phosphate phosphatase n=1 Tax=mine drainage metagenome TaxID=410659 RepID=E6PWX6_9ZZZZ